MFLYTVLICLPILAFGQDLLANQEFNRFDVDSDGQIESIEVQQYFLRYDKDGDGRISIDEYKQEINTHYINTPQSLHTLLKFFDGIDYDKDNHLDQSDFSQLFDHADVNNNNLVNHPEFVTFFYLLTGDPASSATPRVA